MTTLIELAERCEQAAEADYRLDREIWLAAVADDNQRELVRVGRSLHGNDEANFRIDRMNSERFTASLDAALTLTPKEGFLVTVVNARDDHGKPVFDAGMALVCSADTIADAEAVYAATMPLALCSAALRARAAQGIEAATAAETVKLGSVHESPVGGNADAPRED